MSRVRLSAGLAPLIDHRKSRWGKSPLYPLITLRGRAWGAVCRASYYPIPGLAPLPGRHASFADPDKLTSQKAGYLCNRCDWLENKGRTHTPLCIEPFESLNRADVFEIAEIQPFEKLTLDTR